MDADQGLLDTLPDGVVVADRDGIVTVVNDAARRLLRLGDAVGKHLSDVVLLQDRAGNSWFGCLEPYAGLSTRSQLTEQAWYLSDGTELLVTARMVRDAPGAPVRQVAVSVRSARARERLDRERSDLVATVAHELRSPLTGVKGFVATLLSKWDKLNDDQKKMMLETVNADADRLTRLIAELLDVARIDTGRLSLYPRPLDFQAAVERVVASVRAGTGREIAFDVDGDAAHGQRRPRQARAGRHQPRRQRDPARRGPGPADRLADRRPRRRTTGCCCTSTTRARASARTSAAGCSPSSGSTARAAARGWGCTSSTAWSTPTAARWRSTTPRPAGPGSRSCGPRRTAVRSNRFATHPGRFLD